MTATGRGRMQFMIVCKLQNKAEDYCTEQPKCLDTLHICEKQLNYFPYTTIMKEITRDMNNHAIAQSIVVSACTPEQPQTGKTMDEVREFFQQKVCKKPFQIGHFCNWNLNT